jgi:YidC/Oxa1 family membrane protein insertase
MEKRTLIAVVLIMLVLGVNQVVFNRYMHARRKNAPPATAPPMGTGAGTGVPATGATGGPTPAQGEIPTPGQGVPPGVSPAAGAGIRIAPQPLVERTLRGDGFAISFTSEGGSIQHWVLDHFRDPVRRTPQIDLVPEDRRALQLVVGTNRGQFDFSSAAFALAESDTAKGVIAFAAQDSSGLRVEKRYRLSGRGSLLDLDVVISAPPELGPLTYRMGWGVPLPITERTTRERDHQAVAFLGQKLVTAPTYPLGKGKTEPRVENGNVRWAGQRTRYFVAAVIPDSATVPSVAVDYAGWRFPADHDLAIDGSRDVSAATAWLAGGAPPGTRLERHARIYAGPIEYDQLAPLGVGLETIANLGWKWMVPVSVLLLRLLHLLYKLIPNYGIAIIILSAATKLLFYPLTQSSLRSMKVMHRLQPEVNQLRERYKDDPAKMNQAMMSLYKENKVNPLGGCLPMVLQIPVFIALYNVLFFSVELRAAPFFGYIQDLSAPDVFWRYGAFGLHLMPVAMTLSSYMLQSQTPVDPRQKATMYLMPLIMLVFMYSFPSGVVIYWTVNNLLSALQQYLVNRAEDRKLALGAA